ncbi:MAG: acetyl-CoA carboxylase biotin carboxyl carrier protein [Planctomycetes bacterium]|nr:acetyl-CoA carboxylase biotin carboxyl carrier protein [Planctomycetota bacterium]
MADKDADVQKIKELIRIMKENDLVKIDIRHGEDYISLQRAQPQQPGIMGPVLASLPGVGSPIVVPQTSSGGHAGAPGKREELLEIKSPIVGTLYVAPSPDSEPFVDIGSHVDPQTVVCIVEAMKVMNEIKAEVSGTIMEKAAANGQAVEYGQILFRVRPD